MLRQDGHWKIVGQLSINGPSGQLSSRTPPATLSREGRPSRALIRTAKRHAVEPSYSAKQCGKFAGNDERLIGRQPRKR
jgi:hypothetical protein